MRIKRDHVVLAIALIIYLCTFTLWSLPIRQNPYPFGEVDAVSHFGVTNYMAKHDKPVMKLPHFVDTRYGVDNRFKPGYLWYPPPFQVNMALAQVFAGKDLLTQVKAHFYIICSLVSLLSVSLFYVMYRLYGLSAGIIAGVLVIFSGRDRLSYLFGQWPQIMGFAFIPLMITTYYIYLKSVKETPNLTYLYITALLVVSATFFHPQTFFYAVLVLGIASILYVITHKKIPISLKHATLIVLLSLSLLAIFPYQMGNIVTSLASALHQTIGKGSADNQNQFRISDLLKWYKIPDIKPSIAPSYFSFKEMIGSYLLIPLIMLGVIILIIRRNLADLLMFSWVLGLYLLLHGDFITGGRAYRYFASDAHIFYSLIAVAIVSLPSLLPIKKNLKIKLVSILTVVFLLIFVPPTLSKTYPAFKNAYSGPYRITSPQFEALSWMHDNLPENTDVLGLGIIVMAKGYYLDALSHTNVYNPNQINPQEKEQNVANKLAYVLVDYTDAYAFGDQQLVQYLQEWESTNKNNLNLLYNKENVRIYGIAK